jgi:hypothetical protein
LITDDDIKRTILRKMLRLEYIGGRHTSIDNLPKGFPKSERGKVAQVTEKMLKEGYFIVRPKRDSLHVSLDPNILPQVKREIESEE